MIHEICDIDSSCSVQLHAYRSTCYTLNTCTCPAVFCLFVFFFACTYKVCDIPRILPSSTYLYLCFIWSILCVLNLSVWFQLALGSAVAVMLMGFVVIILALTAITMGCRVSVACCRKETEDNARVTNHQITKKYHKSTYISFCLISNNSLKCILFVHCIHIYYYGLVY